MGSEGQDITVQSKKSIIDHHKGKHSHQKSNIIKSKYLSKFICYTSDERGHLARDCPRNKGVSQKKKNYKRIHHAHDQEDDEPSKKRIKKVKILQVMKNMFLFLPSQELSTWEQGLSYR